MVWTGCAARRPHGVSGRWTALGAIRDRRGERWKNTGLRWLSPSHPHLSPELSTGCASLLRRRDRFVIQVRRKPQDPPVMDGCGAESPGRGRKFIRPGGGSVPHPVADPGCQLLYVVVGLPAFGHLGPDLLGGVHDRGVITVAERLADLGQRQVRQLPADRHVSVPGADGPD